MKILNKVALATILTVSSLSAHDFWINSFESYAHKPGHTTVSLGWGHTLPVDDILNSPNGRVIVEDFSITSPSGEKTKLFVPESKIEEASQKTKNFEVFDAQIGLQKIALNKDSEKGTYLIQATTKTNFYTTYIDTKGRERLKLKPMDEIKNIKKMIGSTKFQGSATSYLTIGKWENPKSTGTDLEIRPLSDLSNVKVGDLLKFEVTFKGKPLTYTAKSKELITASSTTYGQGDKFTLASNILKGKAQFRVPAKGQWLVSCSHGGAVTKDGNLKELYGKATSVYITSSLTFTANRLGELRGQSETINFFMG